jgi:hypothetical protein
MIYEISTRFRVTDSCRDMNASEFTRFLRSKTLASGKYVPGIPRESADLLVEKVAKALGVCCDNGGYFYTLADLVIDRTLGDFTANFVAPIPDASFVVISGNSIVTTENGPSITINNGNAPAGDTFVVVTNVPASAISVNGPAITNVGIQTQIHNSAQNIGIALNTATDATLSVQSGVSCTLAATAASVTDASVTTVSLRARSGGRTSTPAIPPAPLNSTCPTA